jgi:predicted transcriptional regulator
MKTTMIQIKKETAIKLKGLKTYHRETYDDLINKLIHEANEEPISAEEIREIEQGLKDVKAGRVYSEEQIAKELGIRLK